jgi:hypothetical protein
MENYDFDSMNDGHKPFWHTKKSDDEGNFCGGMYSMLWRGDRLLKKKMWWTTPIRNAD